MRFHCTIAAAGVAVILAATPGLAAKKYGPGVTDTEITIGQTLPMSGPAQPLGVPDIVMAGYVRMINEHGGVNGRKVNLIQLDNGYIPAKGLEGARELIEKRHVLALMGNLGTGINVSLLRYFRETNVPNLFAISGAAAVNDPAHFPQTVPLLVQYRTEGKVYALHLLQEKPNAKIAVLYQDDILGRDYRAGFRAGLGDRAATMVVAEAAYQLSDPSVDSQVITLQSSGADTLVLFTTPKFAAQALRKTADLGWKPLRVVDINSATVLKPLGAGIATGVLSSNFEKDALDPTWTDDPDMKGYRVFMLNYVPNVDPDDNGAPLGYGIAFVMVEALKRCGDELTREHLLDVVTHLHGLHTPVGLPGTTVDYSPTDYDAQKQFQILRYNGTRMEAVGDLIKG